MTQKELLYVEDAIGHEKNIVSILKDSLNNVVGDDLKNFINEEINEHQQRYAKLMSVLEGKANE